jgi:hypothetical protein
MNITFEEAKQQVAEKYCSELGNTWDKLIARDGLLSQVKYINEAAELWQQSNLDRIKELEDGLKNIIHKYKDLKESRVSNDAHNRQFKGLCTAFIVEAKELLK